MSKTNELAPCPSLLSTLHQWSNLHLFDYMCLEANFICVMSRGSCRGKPWRTTGLKITNGTLGAVKPNQGYRARSAFKLLQIQDKFKLIRDGDVVLDVGCHPGGWSQVAVELVGDGGVVIGVDLEPCQPVEGAILLVGDITEAATQDRILSELDGRVINTIVSDISPDITGNWDIDQQLL